MSEIKTVFDFQAQVGLTKHMGNLPATHELVKLCQILPGYRVLDVGCGAGRTPVYLAKEYHFRMVGVDLHPGMVAASQELARRARVEDRATFRQADAQDLPFKDNTFDAVIVEAVTTFPPDQQQAVSEYARVLKPGGYLGMNESTYLQPHPPAEIINWVKRQLALHAQIHTRRGWMILLENAGLEVMAARLFPLDLKKDAVQTMRRYGVLSMARSWSQAIGMYVSHPASRDVMQLNPADAPPDLMDYFGYGLYIARKPDR
jgi:ubiquinone/menaquinone biosynthesis C-methylase UbiE